MFVLPRRAVSVGGRGGKNIVAFYGIKQAISPTISTGSFYTGTGIGVGQRLYRIQYGILRAGMVAWFPPLAEKAKHEQKVTLVMVFCLRAPALPYVVNCTLIFYEYFYDRVQCFHCLLYTSPSPRD